MDEQARVEPRASGADVPDSGDMPENAAVTGVARGSLGTGTALEETQEWVVPEELRAAPARQDEAMDMHSPEDGRIASVPAAASPMATPVADPAPVASDVAAPASATSRAAARESAAVAPAQRAAPRRRASRAVGGFAATPRAAGIAAVALLALVGVAAVVTSQDQQTPGSVAAPTDLATAAPTAVPPADVGGGNGGSGNKDKNDKGGGNGKGNGGGNGND